MKRWLLFGLLWSAAAAAQSVRVLSEFRRVDPYGEVIRQDAGGRWREILSPSIPRNGVASFQLLVSAPPGERFTLQMAQNPEDMFVLTVYRQLYSRQGGQWLPDRLEKVELPFTGALPRAGAVPDATAVVFWLELRSLARTPARRVRVEAQMSHDQAWVIYPMEVRVLSTLLPDLAAPGGDLPAVAETSAAAALGPIASYLCGSAPPSRPNSGPLTIRGLIRRDAWQDVILARQLEPAWTREKLTGDIFAALGVADPKAW